MIHQNPSHEARCQGEKMGPVLHGNVGLDEAQKRFVNHGGRLEGMTAALGAHVIAGQPPQFVVHQRRESLEGLRMA